MEIEKKLLKKASLEKLFEKLKSENTKMYAPVKKDNLVNFSLVNTFGEICDDYILTVKSAKSVAFPKIEKIVDYELSKDSSKAIDIDTSTFPEVVLWGVRPCDAVGFDSLSAIFTWDSKDTLYLSRLNKTFLISFSCFNSDNNCFCTSVNGNPGGTKGSDILFTKLSNGDYLAEIITEKGKQIMAKAPELFEAAPSEEKEKNLAQVSVKFNVKEITDNSAKFFENELWLEQSLRCIGCGACAFVCPTCACFDIQDESAGKQGTRLRLWDSCGYSIFTMHTSGHNPREVQSQRWRQRIMHKFSYMPERLNIVGCVGCGRCSRACPVDMNISEHLINLTEEVKK